MTENEGKEKRCLAAASGHNEIVRQTTAATRESHKLGISFFSFFCAEFGILRVSGNKFLLLAQHSVHCYKFLMFFSSFCDAVDWRYAHAEASIWNLL